MTAIDCKGLSFLRGTKRILKDVSFSVKAGDFIALIGHNGAGKSTLLKILLGLLLPSTGHVSVLGRLPGTVPEKIGYLPENARLYQHLTVKENLNYFASLRGVSKSRVNQLSESLGIAEVLEQKLFQCSKGQKQRLGLAQALLSDPWLLLLDEPTVGLDPMASDMMYRELIKLKEKGCTVIVCTHELLLAQHYVNNILLLKGGNLVGHGTIEELGDRFLTSMEIHFQQFREVAASDPKLTDFLKENGLQVPKDEVSSILGYLEDRHGISRVEVSKPSLLDIYKAALERGNS